MRLALWQGEGVSGDIQATLAETARVAAAAARSGADLLVFPEGFLTGYYLPDLAPGRLGSVEDALAEVSGVAARTEIGIVMGSHTDDDRTLRNAAVVFDATGAEIGRYCKRSLFGRWEKATFAPGRDMLLFDCAGLSVGVAICYDVEFPELIRPYAQHRADLVVVPTALMAPHDRIARQVVPVRALENQVFLAYCNRTGVESDLNFVGLSCICGPRGQVITSASGSPELLLAELSQSDLAHEREENSYLRDLANL
ncbi:MAG: carbon-nitrogen hydrolase family protein [Rhodobacteraceae bacterium]|nr:carbon-nitrogen hydrolase family protein [Paracoccaceae bacterium]